MARQHDVGPEPRSLLPLAPVSILIAIFYASIYAIRGFREPLGYDIPQYLWRASCAGDSATNLLSCGSEALTLPGRVGFPLISGAISSLIPMSDLETAAALPIALAAAIALCAGALFAAALPRSGAAFATVSLVVGLSPMLVQLQAPEGYLDTMLALTCCLGAAVAVCTQRSAAGLVTAAMLLGTGAIIHWSTGAVFGASLAGVAIFAGRTDSGNVGWGRPFLRTVSGRLSLVLVGAVVLWLVTLLIVIGEPPDHFHGDPAEFATKFWSHLPRYGLPLTVPAAIVGALFLRRSSAESSGSRMVLWVLVAWSLVIGLGLLVWVLGLRTFPPHRLLVLALPIPLLAGGAAICLERYVSRRHPRLARAVPTFAVVVVASGSSVLWLRNSPWLEERNLRSAVNAAAFLESSQVPESTPIVIICDVEGDTLNRFDIMQDTFKMALAPDRIGSTAFYFGEVGMYEKGVPDLSGDSAHDSIALAQWQSVAPVLSTPHVTFVVEGFSSSFEVLENSVPERLVLPGVVVLEGRLLDPQAPVVTRPVALGPPMAVPVFAVATLLLLGIVGYGWTNLGFTTLSLRDRVAVSPAVGIAALFLFSVVIDRGVHVAEGSGELAVAVATASGYGLWFATSRSRRFHRG